MSVDARLAALERTIRPRHDGPEILLVEPESWRRGRSPGDRPAVGPVDWRTSERMSLRYPDEAAVDGELVWSLAEIIPPGPDHAAMLARAESARRRIVITYRSAAEPRWGQP